MGSFSSLLVLTVLRDVALVGARLAHVEVVAWRAAEASALAVPVLALLLTLLGLVQRATARTRARRSTCRSTDCRLRCAASRSRR